MSVHLAEKCLIQHLRDPEALETLLLDGFPLEALPTEELRDIVVWALDYFVDAGMIEAPSLDAFRLSHGPILAETEISEGDPTSGKGWALGEPNDSLAWATNVLKGGLANRLGNAFAKNLAIGLGETAPEKKADVISRMASELVMLDQALNASSALIDVRRGMALREAAYEQRVANKGEFYGMTLGLPEVDEHVYGIHPGEVAVFAAPTKFGKSWMLDFAALAEWRNGRVPALFTLENSVEMTLDRIACIATHVDPRRWQRGECMENEVQRVRDFRKQLEGSPTPFWCLQPEPGRRTMEGMCREAMVRGADSIIVDQLTHVEATTQHNREDLIVRDQMHALKRGAQTGKMSALLAHQVNREGQKAAHAEGRLRVWHMANGAEVERTADMVFGLYQTRDMRMAEQAFLQLMAIRREDIATWLMNFSIQMCEFSIRGRHEEAG